METKVGVDIVLILNQIKIMLSSRSLLHENLSWGVILAIALVLKYGLCLDTIKGTHPPGVELFQTLASSYEYFQYGLILNVL